MRVLFVCPYPPHKAPSQRFRFEQYLPSLDIEYRQVGFWSDAEWPKIYQQGNLFFKIIRTIIAFIRRFFLLFSVWKYDKIFIHREATPIGPPWFEWFATKVFRKPVVYDFDDAIWLPNASEANQKLIGFIKSHSKVAKICTWATTVTAGNQFLADYASQFCKDVRIIPTTIDTDNLLIPSPFGGGQGEVSVSKGGHLRREEVSPFGGGVPYFRDGGGPSPSGGGQGRVRLRRGEVILSDSTSSAVELYRRTPTIGWTGTHSTLKQLIPLFPLLEKLHAEIPFNFLLIADQAPAEMPDFIEFCPWNKSTEIQDLKRIDIGIMPLYNTNWEKGKCGFKALQYMALGIPAVVSNVGVNTEIVQNNLEGFIAEPMPIDTPMEHPTPRPDYTNTSWVISLSTLLKDQTLRKEMGQKGQQKIEALYSVNSQTPAYQSLFASPTKH